MTENTTTVSDTTSSRGAQWAGAGSLIALAAQSLLGGGIGNILGGGASSAAAQAANTAVAIELAKKDSEIAQLKADAATDAKLVQVYTELRRQDKDQDAKIASLNTRVTTLETSAPLREQIVLGQVQAVATASTGGLANLQAQIGTINSTLGNITRCIVPKSAVCPEPMPLYNSFTLPTGPTA